MDLYVRDLDFRAMRPAGGGDQVTSLENVAGSRARCSGSVYHKSDENDLAGEPTVEAMPGCRISAGAAM